MTTTTLIRPAVARSLDCLAAHVAAARTVAGTCHHGAGVWHDAAYPCPVFVGIQLDVVADGSVTR